MTACGFMEFSSRTFSDHNEDFACRSKKTPERSKRVAIGGFILAIVLAVVAAVAGIWFAYIVAAVALLFAAFVWVRANREITCCGGNN